MEELQPQTSIISDIATRKITPETLIQSLEKKHKNAMTIGLIAMTILLPLAIYTNTHLFNFQGEESDRDRLKYINATINILVLLSIFALFFGWIFLRNFQRGFKKNKAFPIYWNYPTGNFFILTVSGLIYYNAVPQQRIFKTTFEGITWTADDFKDIIEDAVKGELSVGSFLPSIKFKQTSNLAEPYIPLSGKSELTVIFCDGKTLKMLIVAIKNENVTSTIRIPVPSSVTFDEEEFTQLCNHFRIKAKCKARFEYFAHTEMERLLSEGSI